MYKTSPRSEGGGIKGERKIAAFMARLSEKGIDVRGLVARANSPIRFIPPHGGNPADGYEATILPDICAVIIDADQKGKLDGRLKRLAERAAMLQHGFATVGIIALVDEATGYQKFRDSEALQKILDQVPDRQHARIRPMPIAATRVCACPTLPCTGLCQARHAQRHARYDDRRGTPSQRGYDRTWQAFVRQYRSGYDLDPSDPQWATQIHARNRCSVAGCRIGPSGLQYDHILPLTQGGARLDPRNIQPLCARHHAIKTHQEQHG